MKTNFFLLIFFNILFLGNLSAQSTRSMTTTIVRLKTTQGPNEGAPCNKIMDFKAEIEQGEGLDHPSLGLVIQNKANKSFSVQEGNNITPNWNMKSVFDINQDYAMLVLKIWDQDDAICGGKDDIVDVSFGTSQQFLRLWVELKTQRIYKVNVKTTANPLVPNYEIGNYVGRTGFDFSMRGNNSSDHAAEITLNIEVKTVAAPTGYFPNKSASLTIALFDDTPFFNLVQNAQLAYGNYFEGYDKSVLLKRTYNGSRKPDRHLKNPSKASFFAELKALAADGYFIDVFIFSHGFEDKISLLENQEEITGQDILNELYYGGGEFANGKFPIRLVYGVHCFGASLRGEFYQVGAKTVIGARRVNFYPNQSNKFISEWNKGYVTVRNAVNSSNTASSRTVMQGLIKLDATHNSPCFKPKCNFGKTVLGTDSKDCAYRYFDCKWGLDYSRYQGDEGTEIMNHSSTMLIKGEENLVKNNRLSW